MLMDVLKKQPPRSHEPIILCTSISYGLSLSKMGQIMAATESWHEFKPEELLQIMVAMRNYFISLSRTSYKGFFVVLSYLCEKYWMANSWSQLDDIAASFC